MKSSGESRSSIYLRVLRVLRGSIWIVFFFIPFTANASTLLKDYSRNLALAEEAVDQLIEGDSSASEVMSVMGKIKRLVPQREYVDFNGQTVQVDNSWLYGEIDKVVKNVNGDIEQRRSMLIDMADRLYVLKERVNAAQTGHVIESNDQRARLEGILARPEYSPEVQKESTFKRWLKMFLNALARFFDGLERSPKKDPGGVSAGTITAFRILVALLVGAATVFGLIHLLKRIKRRRKSAEEKDVREVLGEELPEDITAADLLTNARELARQGDFRTAIRRAYIAALFELELRGKLRMHRSKTNRDYLDSLRSEREIFPSFSLMTGTFEKTWYGQKQSTEDEFNGFVSRYWETVK